MTALLHCIIADIEYERIRNNINIWKYKSQLATTSFERAKLFISIDRQNAYYTPYLSIQDDIKTLIPINSSATMIFKYECNDCNKNFMRNRIIHIRDKDEDNDWVSNVYCKNCKKTDEFKKCYCCDDYYDENDEIHKISLQYLSSMGDDILCGCCCENIEDITFELNTDSFTEFTQLSNYIVPVPINNI